MMLIAHQRTVIARWEAVPSGEHTALEQAGVERISSAMRDGADPALRPRSPPLKRDASRTDREQIAIPRRLRGVGVPAAASSGLKKPPTPEAASLVVRFNQTFESMRACLSKYWRRSIGLRRHAYECGGGLRRSASRGQHDSHVIRVLKSPTQILMVSRWRATTTSGIAMPMLAQGVDR
jgi:hypothetical protein